MITVSRRNCSHHMQCTQIKFLFGATAENYCPCVFFLFAGSPPAGIEDRMDHTHSAVPTTCWAYKMINTGSCSDQTTPSCTGAMWPSSLLFQPGFYSIVSSLRVVWHLCCTYQGRSVRGIALSVILLSSQAAINEKSLCKKKTTGSPVNHLTSIQTSVHDFA